MQKFDFNIRTAIDLERIPQEKFEHYFSHMNYKLKGRFVCIRSMHLEDDQYAILGRLVDADDMGDCFQFHLEIDGHSEIQLITLEPDDVMILFDANEDETEFTSRFIYWDDKYPAEAGFNLKTLINVSRLDKFQLEKYMDDVDHKIIGRKAIVRVMMIDTIDPDIVGKFVSIVISKSAFIEVKIKYGDHTSDQYIGRIDQSSVNDAVLIIFDKDGVNPEYIYWVD